MNRKVVSVTIILSVLMVSLIAGSQTVRVTMANPVFWPSTPNLDEPTLKIKSPSNNSTYDASNVSLSFTVTRPASYDEDTQSFAAHPIDGRFPYLDGIRSINVYLDGKLSNSTNLPKSYLSYTFDFELSQLSPGPHTLNITVEACTFYNGAQYSESDIAENREHDNAPIYRHPTSVSDTVNFTTTIGPSYTQSQSPDAISSYPTYTISPSPTQQPTATPTPIIDPIKVEDSTVPLSTIVVSFAIAIAVAEVAILVYLQNKEK